MIKYFNNNFTDFNNSGYSFSQKVSVINPYTKIFIHPHQCFSGLYYANGWFFINIDINKWDKGNYYNV